jgi:drug/metabolite transporter (DMT)-like permease
MNTTLRTQNAKAPPLESNPSTGPIERPGYQDYFLLVALGAVWGSSFALIKVALVTIPPVTVAIGRVAVGALVLIALVAVQRTAWPKDRRSWLLLAIMGVLGNVIPFSLINWGEVRIDSGLAAILMSTVPLATIVLAPAFVRDEPITAGKVIGVVLGMLGVVILIGPGALLGSHGELLGQLAVAAAAVSYALNGLVARRLPKMPVTVISAGALLCATIAGLPLALIVDQPWQTTPSYLSLAALVGLGIINTACGYLLLFWLTMRAGAGFASFNNFLVPVFGVAWGILLLSERPSPMALLSLVLIFAGLAAIRLWPDRSKSSDVSNASDVSKCLGDCR